MNKSLLKFLKISIPLGIGIFLIYYSYSKFTNEQLQEISFYFNKADYTIVALAVFFNLFSHFLRAFRWNFMLESLGYKPSIANNFMAVNVAYIMNLIIPKSGEISRAAIIKKYEDVPFDNAFGTIISERAVDVIFLLLITVLAFILQFDIMNQFLDVTTDPTKFYWLFGGLVLLGILFLLYLKFSKSVIQQKLIQFYFGLKEGVLTVLKMKKKSSFILYSVFIWILYFLSFYTAFFALDETIGVSLSVVIIAFVVGSFSFAFTNSGFGSYPFFVASVLAVFQIPETVGTAFGWIVWTSSIVSIIFFGGLSLIILPFYNRNK